ncbi:MAG: PQQ-dependent sugar dehydrogenase [Saprospiraceae bacterium]|nr:PQQ-dependent sugar dehydrogenase [Saprospiraceae bacterium]
MPAGNPFGNEVFAYGLRNLFRWGFDRIKGDFWIGDVGQENFEEFNYRPMHTVAGANFGWRCYEGKNVFNASVGCGGGLPAFVFPVSPYMTQNPAASAVGGVVYRGYTYEAMKGYYIGADYYSGIFYKIKYDSLAMVWTTAQQTLSPTAIADFGENEAGELFAVALNAGTLYRVTAAGQVNTTYVFTGNGAWSLATNWAGGVVPPATVSGSAYVVVKPRKGGICNLDVMQTILLDSYFVVEPGAQFNINSNLNLIK